MIIGVQVYTDANRKDVDKSEVFGLGATINHEEVAHATADLQGLDKSNSEGHKDYYGIKKEISPSPQTVLSDKKYEGTEAKVNFEELRKIIYID